MRFSLYQRALVRIYRVHYVCGVAIVPLISPLVGLWRAFRRAFVGYKETWRDSHRHARWFLENTKHAATLDEAVAIANQLPPDAKPDAPLIAPGQWLDVSLN